MLNLTKQTDAPQAAGQPSQPKIQNSKLNIQNFTPLLVAGLFLAVAGLVTWPLLPHAADSLRDPGDPALFIWTLHWLAYAAFHDPAQIYAGPIFHGFPNPV